MTQEDRSYAYQTVQVVPATAPQTTVIAYQAARQEGVAWILWLGCCLGLFGLHRCYVGKWCSGIVWFFTAGLCGIGQLIDACFMRSLVEEANRDLAVIGVTTAPQVIYQPVAVPQYAQPVPQQYMQQQQPGQYPAAGTNPPSYYNPPSNNY